MLSLFHLTLATIYMLTRQKAIPPGTLTQQCFLKGKGRVLEAVPYMIVVDCQPFSELYVIMSTYIVSPFEIWMSGVDSGL